MFKEMLPEQESEKATEEQGEKIVDPEEVRELFKEISNKVIEELYEESSRKILLEKFINEIMCESGTSKIFQQEIVDEGRNILAELVEKGEHDEEKVKVITSYIIAKFTPGKPRK